MYELANRPGLIIEPGHSHVESPGHNFSIADTGAGETNVAGGGDPFYGIAVM